MSQNHDGEFHWDSTMQGYLLSSFFYGYVITQIPFGILAKRYGSKYFLGIGMLINSMFGLLVPVSARAGYHWLMIVRFIQGLGEVSDSIASPFDLASHRALPPPFFFFFFLPPSPNSTDPIGKDRKVFNISLVERFLIVRVYFLPLGMDYPYCRVLLCLAHTRCWPSGYRLMNVVEWEPSYTLVSSLVSTISFRFFRPCRVYHHGKLLGSSGKTNLPPSPISLLHLLLFHFLTYSLLLILLLLLVLFLIHSRVN